MVFVIENILLVQWTIIVKLFYEPNERSWCRVLRWCRWLPTTAHVPSNLGHLVSQRKLNILVIVSKTSRAFQTTRHTMTSKGEMRTTKQVSQDLNRISRAGNKITKNHENTMSPSLCKIKIPMKGFHALGTKNMNICPHRKESSLIKYIVQRNHKSQETWTTGLKDTWSAKTCTKQSIKLVHPLKRPST